MDCCIIRNEAALYGTIDVCKPTREETKVQAGNKLNYNVEADHTEWLLNSWSVQFGFEFDEIDVLEVVCILNN